MSWIGSTALVPLVPAGRMRSENGDFGAFMSADSGINQIPYQLAAHLESMGTNIHAQIISVMAIGSRSVLSGSTYPFSHDPAAATVWASDQILASLLVQGGRP